MLDALETLAHEWRVSPGGIVVVDDDPVMRTPGFKVLHQPGVDTNSTCLTLKACLTLVREWSDAHPGHVPIAVYLEAQDAAFGPDRLARLEAEIRSVIPRRQLLTPDDVRGDAATPGDAVRERGGRPSTASAGASGSGR